MVAAEAYRRTPQGGLRAAACWAMAPTGHLEEPHEKWFSGLVPIVDFVHALTYSGYDGDRVGFKCHRTLAIVSRVD